MRPITLFLITSLPLFLISLSIPKGDYEESLSVINGEIKSIRQIDSTYWILNLVNEEPTFYFKKKRLKYPYALNELKKGDNITLYGHYSMESRLSFDVHYYYTQLNDTEFKKVVSKTRASQNIKIENNVSFSSYTDDNLKAEPKIDFSVTVINHSSQSIPALSPSNNGYYHLEKPLLSLFINGKSNGLSIYNGIGYLNEVIPKNGGSSTKQSWILIEDSGIYTFGEIITIQWEYMGVKSDIVTVDLKNKKIIP